MLGDQELLQSQMRSKALHQAVAMQTKAQTELLKVQEARRAYITAWSDYTAKLQAVLSAQQTEQSKVLGDFTEHKEKWKQQLKESTAALSRLSEDVQKVSSDEDSDRNTDMKIVKDDLKDPWEADETTRQLKESQIELHSALARAKEKAEAASQELPARERTPRRTAREGAEPEVPIKAPA